MRHYTMDTDGITHTYQFVKGEEPSGYTLVGAEEDPDIALSAAQAGVGGAMVIAGRR